MNSNSKNLFRVTFLAIIATTLTACGGGGSGSMSAAPTPAPVAVAQAGNLLTAMPNAVYSAGTTTALAFNELNTARLAGGYGAATQNMQLDKAAAAHAVYFFSKWFTRPVMSVDENFRVQRDSLGNIIYWKGMDTKAVEPDPLNKNVLRAHLETPGEPGFTGVMPSDRAAAAGYGFSSTVGEVIGS